MRWCHELVPGSHASWRTLGTAGVANSTHLDDTLMVDLAYCTSDPDAREAIRLVRERAMRQVMVLVHRVQVETSGVFADVPALERAFKRGHLHARMQIYDAIVRMILKEPMPPAEYEPEGDAAEPVEED